MNRKIMEEPNHYRNHQLMEDLNKFIIAVKIHAGLIDQDAGVMSKLIESHPMPDNDEVNALHHRLNEALKQDSYNMRKR